MKSVVIHWFRRDLRLFDNAALSMATNSGVPVLPIFIFDTNILQYLNPEDRRVGLIYKQLQDIDLELKSINSSLKVFHTTPLEAFKELLEQFKIVKVFTNEDYEPYAIKRDYEVSKFLKSKNIELVSCKDQVVFAKQDVLKADGTPYTVFTPYSRKWKEAFHSKSTIDNFVVNKSCFLKFSAKLPSITSLGFNSCKSNFPSVLFDVIQNYAQTRDFPALQGTSKVGFALRFGLLSIRQLVKYAIEQKSETYLNELIWREFYMMILFHFPQVVDKSFKAQYDKIEWINNEQQFELWCQGKTGYPLVDAGMRELNTTGYMHNRVRMVVASFLTKHLLIDWRWGEAYFASKLLDYDLSANNGGWQWAAGCGCDAAPYFRVFNPTEQQKKFDPEYKYIKKWIPEFSNKKEYIKPIVDHKFARERVLKVYKNALTQ